MVENVIIAGPSRTGKTTLARKLNRELGHFVISVDKLVATFHGAYPQLNIRLNWNREATTDNIAPFLAHFLGAFSSNLGVAHELNLRAHCVEGNRFVLEGGYFNLDKMLPILKQYGMEQLGDRFLLVGLVQNNKTPDEFVRDLREYDTRDDWTYGLSDDELREYAVQEAIPFSRSMTGHLRKHGFTIYDTSAERERVLDRIVEDIRLAVGRRSMIVG